MAFQGDSIYWVELEKVVPNPFQPRREFDQKKLEELSESIRMYGVLQPLTVTRNEVQRDDGTFYTEYELIAGERRLRASKLAGVAQVPVIIREGEQSEQEKLELAIIENLQREDLNAVDRALAFRQLAESFGLSHAQVAEKVGRSREYVSNSIRLLGLPDHILTSLKHGELMEGHARTLLMLTDRPEEQQVIFKEILLKKLSVREVERIVRKIATDKVRKKNAKDLDVNLIELEKQFTESLGTRVQIQKTDFGGKLTIDYFSEDDLAVILKRIGEEAGVSINIDNEQIDKISEHTGLEVDTDSNESQEVSTNPAEPETEVPYASETQATEPSPAREVPENQFATEEASQEEPVAPVPAPSYDNDKQHSFYEVKPEQSPVNNVPEDHFASLPVTHEEPASPAPAPDHAENTRHGFGEQESPAPTPIPPPPPAPIPSVTSDQSAGMESKPETEQSAWQPKSDAQNAPEKEVESETASVEENASKEDDSDLYSIRNFNV